MLDDLDALETKLALLIERHQALRAENARLRQQVVAAEHGNKLLSDRLAEVRGRMENLFDKLPD
jgi:regulator of replication initiation timing